MSRIRGKASDGRHETMETVVGIDVSKAYLDVCLHPSGDRFRVSNDARGHIELQTRCTANSVGRAVMEATGRYHRAAHARLHDAGIQVAIVNPYRTRRFADVLGRLAKTDEIDAEVLAQFAAVMKPAATEPPSATMAQITEITVARRQVVDERLALESQRSLASLELVKEQLDERIALCRHQCKVLEAELLAVIRREPSVARSYAILTSIPGIGPTTAATLLSEMKELGSANAAEVAALAGVAPMNRDHAGPEDDP